MRERAWSTAPILVVAIALAIFLAVWGGVLTGHESLIGTDILPACCLPWHAQPGPHAPRNGLSFDPTLQILPWFEQVRDAWTHGRLPLWNPFAFSGAPLLANDSPAAFSPFTWLALPFAPTHGLSIAMLAKVWVAGVGMALFVRSLGARPLASTTAGFAYATSSYIVVWLAWPHSSVAALAPWCFLFVERYLLTRRSAFLVGFAVSIALQLVAGHAETSLHFGVALALYVCIRAYRAAGWRPLTGLAVAGVMGGALAGAQLVPFVAGVRDADLLGQRAGDEVGIRHLAASAATSWVAPNVDGNPGIDQRNGRPPNYQEATGFAGVGTLVLAPLGARALRRRNRGAGVALATVVAVPATVVYTPAARLFGHLPLFDATMNTRFIGVICFGVCALAGLGLDACVGHRGARRTRMATGLLTLGAVALLALVAAGGLLAARGSGVDDVLPPWNGWIGFWAVVAGASAVAAAAFLGAVWVAGSARLGSLGLALLAVAEGALFAGPYNPRLNAGQDAPPSAVVAWLRSHADGAPVTAVARILIPNSESLYGLRDVRGSDALHGSRLRAYWARADPEYGDLEPIGLITLGRPDARWLARAGVRYVVTDGTALPGTVVEFQGEGVRVAAVPGARPFASLAGAVATASGPLQAAAMIGRVPAGTVVVEDGCCARTGYGIPADAAATARLRTRTAESVTVDVASPVAATVVILQSYSPGWVATVDGRGAAVRPADVLFQAVSVPAGRHRVELRYEPRSVAVGFAFSAVGLLSALALLVLPALRRRPVRTT